MEIYVVRHGLTELNKQGKVNGEIDDHLAPEGVEQVNAAISLMPDGIAQIYSSRLRRARQTAKIINSKLNLPISFREELSEVRMGSLAGKAWTEMEGGLGLKKLHRSVRFDYRPYGGESVAEVQVRVLAFLREISTRHKDREVLIVTHGGIIRVLHLLETGETTQEDIKHISPQIFDLNRILR